MMSYLVQARLAQDVRMLERVTACVAGEGVVDPFSWAVSQMWILSAQPGWADAYKYAVDSGVEDPGADESVITDGQILAAVQSLLVED